MYIRHLQFVFNIGSSPTRCETVWFLCDEIYERYYWRIGNYRERFTSINSNIWHSILNLLKYLCVYHFALIIFWLFFTNLIYVFVHSSSKRSTLEKKLMKCVPSGQNAYKTIFMTRYLKSYNDLIYSESIYI